MKKFYLLLSVLLLVACQGKQSTNNQQTKIQPSTTKDSLILKEWRFMIEGGDGNDEGYYRIVDNDEGEMNILYLDYASGKEVYLCDKPECQHQDDSCTSYLSSGFENLFVYKNHIYLIERNGMTLSLDGGGNSTFNSSGCIYQMDLDGKNKKELYRLEEGYDFESGNLIIGDDKLYLPISKTESFNISQNSSTQITMQNELYSIDLKTGEAKKILELQDGLKIQRDIIAVDDRNIILSRFVCEKDPQSYLDNNDFDEYDKIVRNAKIGYEIVNIDTLEKEAFDTDEKAYGSYYKQKIYQLNNNEITAYNLNTKKEENVLSLPKNYSYSLDIYNHYMVIQQWQDETFQKQFVLDLNQDNAELVELKQYTRAPKEAVNIIGMNNKNLLIIYDREGQEEKTWAGTMQYEVSKEYYGLISIEDFFSSKQSYQKLTIIQ